VIVISKNLGLQTFGFYTFLLFPLMIAISWFTFREVEERCLKVNIPTVSKRSAARRTRYFPLNSDALKYSTLIIILFISFVNLEAGNGKPLATTLFKSKVVEPWVPPVKTNIPESLGQQEPSQTESPSLMTSYEAWNEKIFKGLKMVNLPEGIQPGLSQLDSDRLSRWSRCLSILSDIDACNSGSKLAGKKVYILGDSYALSLTPMIQGTFSGLDYYVIARNRGQCMVPDATPVRNNLADTDCDLHRKKINEEISRVKPDIIIATSWNAAVIVGGDKNLLSGMEKQFNFLKSHSQNLIVVGETPAIPDPRKCFISNNETSKCIGKSSPSNRYRLYTEQIAKKVDVPYLDLATWMCYSNNCPPVIDNNFVTWDGGHLTTAFSSKLSPLFRDYLSSIGVIDKTILD
jgi:hypothetical protein